MGADRQDRQERREEKERKKREGRRARERGRDEGDEVRRMGEGGVTRLPLLGAAMDGRPGAQQRTAQEQQPTTTITSIVVKTLAVLHYTKPARSAGCRVAWGVHTYLCDPGWCIHLAMQLKWKRKQATTKQ